MLLHFFFSFFFGIFAVIPIVEEIKKFKTMKIRTRKKLARCNDVINALYEELLSVNHNNCNRVEKEVLGLLIDRINDCRILSRTISSTKLTCKTKSYAGKIRLL